MRCRVQDHLPLCKTMEIWRLSKGGLASGVAREDGVVETDGGTMTSWVKKFVNDIYLIKPNESIKGVNRVGDSSEMSQGFGMVEGARKGGKPQLCKIRSIH